MTFISSQKGTLTHYFGMICIYHWRYWEERTFNLWGEGGCDSKV